MDEEFMLYQYTSLETLALILHNKNIKFNKLKLLDDPLEKYVKGIVLSNGRLEEERINLGEYCLVSCWTKDKEESISMWDMYGDRKKGVRIGLPVNMFDLNYNINDSKDKRKKKPLFEIHQKNIMPEKVEVVYDRDDDPNFLDKNTWKTNISVLGKYKISDWKFQKEFRFRLFACNKNENNHPRYYTSDTFEKMCNFSLDRPIDNNFTFFKLDEKIFSEMEILRGPEIPDGNRFLLDALIEKYGLDSSKIYNSKYTDEKNSLVKVY